MAKKQKDATDYLETPEVKEMIAQEKDRAWEYMAMNRKDFEDPNHPGVWDPQKMMGYINRQVSALKETLIYDLPDEYLPESELREREQRRREIPTLDGPI